MFSNLEPEQIEEIIRKALGIIHDQKAMMVKMKLHTEPDINGIPHVIIRDLGFVEDWLTLPDETFRGDGMFRMLEHDCGKIVIYYKIKCGGYFIKHSVDVPFGLHVVYGEVTCTVSGGNLKKGATGQAEANQLHQLCFPADTGMIITFDLSSGQNKHTDNPEAQTD